MEAQEPPDAIARSEKSSGPRGRQSPPRGSAWRASGIALVATAGAAFFLHFVNDFYAVEKWLFWPYFGAALFAAIWALSCLAAGHRALRLILRMPLRFADEVTLGFPLGVAIFGYGIFFFGLLGLLGKAVFVLWPAALLATGRPLYRSTRRLVGHVRRRNPGRTIPGSWLLVAAPITVGVLFLYYPLLSPLTFSHDSRWYHLGMAEHYAASGAIRRFPEGWWLGAFPQLASYLYTWAFLRPRAVLIDHLELCAHIEFVTVLFVLVAIPSLVRLFLHGARASTSAVVFFLFPCIYLYDSNLCVGADHTAAAFAIPIALALARFLPEFDRRWGLLFAMYLSGALVTKYSAVILCAFPVAAVLLRALWLTGRGVRGGGFRWLAGLGIVVSTGLALTSIHWLKNWAWYGDPLYPQLRHVFAAHPWNRPEAEDMYARFAGMVAPARPGIEGIIDGLKATVTFSFVPNDWTIFHRDWPTFGSLFTLTLPFVVFLRKPGRLALGYLAVMLTVFVWYEMHHYDRFLQAVLPWMAAATAAALTSAWRMRSLLVRIPVSLLVAIQVVWGGDVPFFPTHNMIDDSMIRHVATQLASGFVGLGFPGTKRIAPYEPWGSIGKKVPPSGRVLVHDCPMHVGMLRPVVQDLWSGKLSYSELATPSAVYDTLKELGVTHLVWETQRAPGELPYASDLVFFEFATQYARRAILIAERTLAQMPYVRPADVDKARKVAVFACGGQYRTGWYPLSALTVPASVPIGPPPSEEMPSTGYDSARLLRDASFIIRGTRCQPALPEDVTRIFVRAAVRSENELWVKRPEGR